MKTTTPTNTQLPVHIKWMIRRDMPEVLAMESACFEYPWTEDDFIRCLRQRNNIGMCAVHDDKVVGAMIYELNKSKLHLLNFMVHEDWRYKGVGRQMIAKLVSKWSHERRGRIVMNVRESNVDCQLFLKRLGFRCVTTLRNFYEETDEDAYQFSYRCVREEDDDCEGRDEPGEFDMGEPVGRK